MHSLSKYEENLICESLKETSENVSVNGNDNGSYRFDVNSESSWYKSELILKLKQCNSSTSPKEISFLLKRIFKYWLPPKENHWLNVAQNFTARTLNWVMSATTKKYLQGGIKKNPAAYFTYLLSFRKMRKEFRGTNGSC